LSKFSVKQLEQAMSTLLEQAWRVEKPKSCRV